MSHTYFTRRRFHIGYSVLGKVLRRRISDSHYAEGVFIITFALLFIALVLANYLGWALVEPFLSGSQGNSIAFMYWIGQASTGLIFFLFCAFGFKPALHVKLDAHQLIITQGRNETLIPLDSIQATNIISALRFHRHYRKYSATYAFYVGIAPSFLLLTTDYGPVILGLNETDQQELQRLLQPQSEKIVFSSLSPIV